MDEVRLAILAMALGAFAIGLTEFAIMGLLPQVATDLSVSVPTAGNLVTAYAVGVVVGAPLLTAAGARLSRRTLLLAFMALFAVGNGLAALAPGFGTLLAARFLTGLPHGAFFGVAALVAADSPDRPAARRRWGGCSSGSPWRTSSACPRRPCSAGSSGGGWRSR